MNNFTSNMVPRHDVTEIEDFRYKIPINTVNFKVIEKNKMLR